ncbi:MAG: ATP synthase F1 subunit gamma [Candidatus Zixiibacteriota bacterium]
MQALREIRRRIRSVQNTQQITKAMEMVAAAKLRKAEAKARSARPYAQKLEKMLENLSLASGLVTHPLFEKRENVKKRALLLVTSDRGLCGSYNTNILRRTEVFLRDFGPGKVELLVVGKKAYRYFLKQGWEIRYKYLDLDGKFDLSQVRVINRDLTELFVKREVDEVFLLYTKFINPISYKLVLEKFLNIEPREKAERVEIDYIFEPNSEKIFNALLPRYCMNVIQKVLLESFASEQGSRMTAMRAATENAEEMIENLTLIRNKVRQATITREMLEIASGAEALKG